MGSEVASYAALLVASLVTIMGSMYVLSTREDSRTLLQVATFKGGALGSENQADFRSDAGIRSVVIQFQDGVVADLKDKVTNLAGAITAVSTKLVDEVRAEDAARAAALAASKNAFGQSEAAALAAQVQPTVTRPTVVPTQAPATAPAQQPQSTTIVVQPTTEPPTAVPPTLVPRVNTPIPATQPPATAVPATSTSVPTATPKPPTATRTPQPETHDDSSSNQSSSQPQPQVQPQAQTQAQPTAAAAATIAPLATVAVPTATPVVLATPTTGVGVAATQIPIVVSVSGVDPGGATAVLPSSWTFEPGVARAQTINFANAGLNGFSLTFKTAASGSVATPTPLWTDRTNGLQLVVVSGPNEVYRGPAYFAATTTDVFLGTINPGASAVLTMTFTLPSTAPNTYQGLTQPIDLAFTMTTFS